MTPLPSVDIVIVNYKTADLTCRAVQTAKDRAARDNVPVKIFVVDNGSEDGSLETIGAAHPDIRLIDAGGNIGFAAGNNRALREATSPYILLLNSDAFLEEHALGDMVTFMEREKNTGMVGPRVLNPDGTDQDYPCRFPTIAEMILRAVAGPQFPGKNQNRDQALAIDRIHGCCLMVRKAVVDRIGLLDEQFFMYDEDMDWCLRARRAGWDLFLLPYATVTHLGGQTSGRAPSGKRAARTARPFNPRMSMELRKSRYILYRKHRHILETALLKMITDSVLCLALLIYKVLPGDPENARRRTEGYKAIIALEPLSWDVRP